MPNGEEGEGAFAEPAELADDRREELVADLKTFANENGWRMISYAHMQLSKEDFMSRVDPEGNGEILQSIFDSEIQGGFSYLASFGLKDSLRPEVKSAVVYATKQAELTVRLVSNDLEETAVQAALKSSIISEVDLIQDSGAIMSGQAFADAVGGIVDYQVPNTTQQCRTLQNMTEFQEIQKKLKVLYRATSSHKEALVVGLKSLRVMNQDVVKMLEDASNPEKQDETNEKQRQIIENQSRKIVVTGEGVNDINALAEAQVGVAMSSGVSSAKASANLVLTDNNFKSCLQAVLWGRNIFQNVTRFLQFQITVNLSCVLVVFIGIFFYSEMPFSAAQLLWINLIMDVIGAIALGTEPPMPSLVKGNPRDQTSILKQKQVWRQIVGVSIYNTLVILLLFIFGPNIVMIDKDVPWAGYVKKNVASVEGCNVYPKALEDGMKNVAGCQEYRQSAAKGTLLSYVFNTFVFLQIFNLINSRKIGIDDKNVFESPLHNAYFIIAFFGMIAVQVVLVQYTPWLIDATPLQSRSEWGAAITVGSSVLLIAFILKLTPKAWVQMIPDVVDEDNKTTNPYVDQVTGFINNKPTETPDAEAGDATYGEEEPAADEEQDGGESVDAEATLGNGYSRIN